MVVISVLSLLGRLGDMSRVMCSLVAIVALFVTAAAERDAAADEAVARAKPSSFAPRGRPGPRAYGAPIQGTGQSPVMKRGSRPRPPAHPRAPR